MDPDESSRLSEPLASTVNSSGVIVTRCSRIIAVFESVLSATSLICEASETVLPFGPGFGKASNGDTHGIGPVAGSRTSSLIIL
ncbi:hypothetical protein BpHYR1_015388 [Brachionus plicatilis]|uniref:Uncharacterized protein n=1 Tax=Brachionus plicatilis TaxID=10195 RepID=A0A3M7PFV0_BRAPC|nr:hypothetical protein BpHYR1_015388 [Brachionus plicatilis]